MVMINVKSDFIDDVQAIVDVCDGDGRSLECRTTVILAKKLLGAINQTNRGEFNIEVIDIKQIEVITEGNPSSEIIQSTENVDEHLEKTGEKVIIKNKK